jgi:hypothetical protein
MLRINVVKQSASTYPAARRHITRQDNVISLELRIDFDIAKRTYIFCLDIHF